MPRIENLKIKVFADGADLNGIIKMKENPLICGFTTNPTLMRKAGIANYEVFARKVLEKVTEHPVSFEVFADDFPTMIRQGRVIASWGKNVNVKIPVMNTKGEFSGPVLRALAAIMNTDQVHAVAQMFDPAIPAIVSVFAGRVADTGIDPVPLMSKCKEILASRPKAELLWASPRELLNIFQADEAGCQIITVSHELLAKLSVIGKDLDEYSLETVQMFYRDAVASGFEITEAGTGSTDLGARRPRRIAV
jgi:transaldolase